MQSVLLRSKITVPTVSKEAIERRPLMDLLKQRERSKLTIVRAPAGYGKTTLLSQWANLSEDWIAWLSLDEADSDPIRFWKYVIRAVSDSLQGDMDRKLSSLLQSQPQLPLDMLVDSFLNELMAVQVTIRIVLDDYHLINNERIHEMMTRFIDYLPGHVHVYIASRADSSLPIYKWAVKGWLTEINMEELLFTIEETARYYEMRKLVIKDDEQLQRILAKTEGWAAGIQLAGLSMEASSKDNWKMNSFTESHAFISDIFLKEILSRLPQSTQDFLITTSILHQLEPAVCDALTHRSDSEEMLLELEKNGLFIIRLHTATSVFRYHHLFTDILQAELRKRYSQEMITSIYKKAATILYELGDIHSAIELALNGHSYADAEAWIHIHIVELFFSGQTSTFIRWIRTLQRADCPLHPETLVMYAFTLALSGKWESASQVIESLANRHETDQWMDQPVYKIVSRGWVTVKVYVLFAGGGNLEEAIELMREKLKGGLVNSKWDGIPVQYNRVEPKLLRTSIGSLGKLWPDEKVLPFYELFRTSAYKDQNMTGFSYGLRAETLYEKNQIDDALPELEEALRYGHRFQNPGLFVPMYIMKSRIYVTRRQFVQAHALLDYTIDMVKDWHWSTNVYAVKAQYLLLEGSAREAEQALYKMTNESVQSGNPLWLLVHTRILIAKGLLEDAIRIVIQVKEKALSEGQISTIVEAAVLEAICQMKLLNADTALPALHEALEHGSLYGYVRTFLDEPEVPSLLRKYVKKRKREHRDVWDTVPLAYVEHLLESVPEEEEQDPALKMLTLSERKVLILLSSGASNIEIASELGLTEGTVRVYLTNIYQKLGVNSRTQAVLFAREREL